MSSLLDQYDAHVAAQMKEIREKCAFLTRSRRMHDALKCLNQEIPRRTEKFAETRSELLHMLNTQTKEGTEKALEIFERVVGKPFERILHIQTPRATSPRSILNTRRKVNVYQKGGPVHPNLLARTMKYANGRVLPEFRNAAKLSFKTRKNRSRARSRSYI